MGALYICLAVAFTPPDPLNERPPTLKRTSKSPPQVTLWFQASQNVQIDLLYLGCRVTRATLPANAVEGGVGGGMQAPYA